MADSNKPVTSVIPNAGATKNKAKPSSKPPVKSAGGGPARVSLIPNYGSVFTPFAGDSHVNQQERSALDNLLSDAGTGGVDSHPDVSTALHGAGLLHVPTSSKGRAVGKKNDHVYASAVDALDAVAGGIGSIFTGDNVIDKKIGEGIGWYKKKVLEKNPELGKRDGVVTNDFGKWWSESGPLGAYKAAVEAKNPEVKADVGGPTFRDVVGGYKSAVEAKNPEVRKSGGATLPQVALGALDLYKQSVEAKHPEIKNDVGGKTIGDIPSGPAIRLFNPLTDAEKQKIVDLGGSVHGDNFLGGAFEAYTRPGLTLGKQALGESFIDGGLTPVASAGSKLTYAQLVKRREAAAQDEAMKQFLAAAQEHKSAVEIQSVQDQAKLGPLVRAERVDLLKLAKANGWDVANPRDYTDAELAYRAFTVPNKVEEIRTGLFRQTGQLASLPAFFASVVSAANDAVMHGNTETGKNMLKEFWRPFAYVATDAEKRGWGPAIDSFVNERPLDAILLASGTIRAVGRGSGAGLRTIGGTGESGLQVGLEQRGLLGAPVEGSRRARVGAYAATNRPIGVSIGGVEKYLNERPGAASVIDATLPQDYQLTLGYTGSNLVDTIALSTKAWLIDRGLKSNNWLARIAATRRADRALRNIYTARDTAAGNATRALREIGSSLTPGQRERLTMELIRTSVDFAGEPLTLADAAVYWRNLAQKALEDAANPDLAANRVRNRANAALWNRQAADYERWANTSLDQGVIDAAREAVKPIGLHNDMYMASVIDALTGGEDVGKRGVTRVGMIVDENGVSRPMTFGDVRPGQYIDLSSNKTGTPSPALVTEARLNADGTVTITRENVANPSDVKSFTVPASRRTSRLSAGVTTQKYVRDFILLNDQLEQAASMLKKAKTGEARAAAAEHNAPVSRLEKLDAERQSIGVEIQKRLDLMNAAREAGSLAKVRRYAKQYAVKVYALRAKLLEMEREAIAAGIPEVAAQMRRLADSIFIERRDLGGSGLGRVADRAMKQQDNVAAAVADNTLAPVITKRIEQPAAAALVENAQSLEARAAELGALEARLVAERDAAPSSAKARAAAQQLDSVRAEIDALVQQAGGLRRSPSGFVGALDALERRFEFVTGANVRSLMSGKGRYGAVVADERPVLLSVLGELRRKVEDGAQITKDDIAALVDAEARVARVERMVGKRKSYKTRDASIVEPVGFGRKTVAQTIDTSVSAERVAVGVVEDMRNRFWNQIDNVFRERYSDKRPGWVSVEYVRARDLRNIEGNVVEAEKVAALRGQEYENPIILDYDPATGYAYVSEGNHRLAAAADDQWVPIQVMTGKVTPNIRPNAKRITEPGVLIDSDRYVPSYLYPHEVGLSVREAPVRVGKPSMPGELVGQAFERGARLDELNARVAARETAPSVASIREVRKFKKMALRQAELNRREAARIIERGKPIVSEGELKVVFDAATEQIAVELPMYKVSPIKFTIDKIRNESKNDFIARAEMNGHDPVLYLGTESGTFGMSRKVQRLEGGIDVSAGAGIKRSRTMENQGVVYNGGYENFSNLWNRLLRDTGALVGNVAWLNEMKSFVEGISIRVDSMSEADAAAYNATRGAIANLAEGERVVFDARRWVAVSADRTNPISNATRTGSTDVEAALADLADPTLADLFAKTAAIEDVVAAGGNYYLIPEFLYKQIVKELGAIQYRPQGGLAFVNNITKEWRSFTLNIFPRTGFANLIGSASLAALAGAGPRSFYLAYRHLRYGDIPAPAGLRQAFAAGLTNEQNFARIRSRLPTASFRIPGETRRGLPLGRNVSLDTPFAGLAWWMNTMRAFNGISEDFGRLAVWYSRAYPEASRLADVGFVKTWTTGRVLSEEAQNVLESLARGNDPNLAAQSQRFVDLSFEWLGDLHAGGKTNTILRTAVPFQQWYRHIIRLTFVTMPLKYPGRMLFLQRLSEIGHEYLIEHGIYPSWMMDVIPILIDEKMLDGVPQEYILAWHAGSSNPFGTPAQAFAGDQQQFVDWGAGMLNPLVRGIGELAFGAVTGSAVRMGGDLGMKKVKNQANNEIRTWSSDGGKFYLNTIIRMLPLSSMAMSAAGQSAEGNLLFGGQDKLLRGAEGPMPAYYLPPDAPGKDVAQLATDFSWWNAAAFATRSVVGGSPTYVIGHGPIEDSQFAVMFSRYRRDYLGSISNVEKSSYQLSQTQGDNAQVQPQVQTGQAPSVLAPISGGQSSSGGGESIVPEAPVSGAPSVFRPFG
jgi:hypothetical protein